MIKTSSTSGTGSETGDFNEIECLRKQLAIKIDRLAGEISTAGTHQTPYLLERIELFETQLALLTEDNTDPCADYAIAQDFRSR